MQSNGCATEMELKYKSHMYCEFYLKGRHDEAQLQFLIPSLENKLYPTAFGNILLSNLATLTTH